MVKKKKVAKKKVAKKKVAKKKVAKKKVAKKKVAKTKVVKQTVNTSPKQKIDQLAKKVAKARTKGDILNIIAQHSGINKKDVINVLDSLTELLTHDVGKKGPGIFTLPGLFKVVRVKKPATKARKGINPFTKEPMIFKAKPARSIVRVRPLKALKDGVE